MLEKRTDLQGIRGIAILLVLAFHLKPKLFPSGFIGVDMFFVLSGYLMTMILSKKDLDSMALLDFYQRRFKRIVPLFVFILTVVYGVGWFYLMEIDRLQLLTDLKWSWSFTSNMQPLFEANGYWVQVLSYRFLVHCWSLGVEIQFYLVAPFILGYCRQGKWNYLLYIIFFSSFIFQSLSSPKIAHGLLLSRIWQFLCGTIAFEIEEKTAVPSEYQQIPDDEICLLEEAEIAVDTKLVRSSLTCTIMRELLAICLMVIVFINPSVIGDMGMRMLVVFLTTAFICSSNVVCSSFVTFKPLVYIGNISYTLYLVHWPTIVFYKYYNSLTDITVIGLFWCISVMLLITIVIYHTLESFLVKTRLLYGVLIFAACILFIGFTSPFYEKDIQVVYYQRNSNESEIIANAIRINAEEDKRGAVEDAGAYNGSKNYFWVPCHRDFETDKWTHWTNAWMLRCITNSTGSLNVLVVGNSIAYRAFPTIHQLFRGRFNTMRLFTTNGLPGIYSSTAAHARFETAVKLLVENFKPDVIFVVFTTVKEDVVEGAEMQAPVVDWNTDKVLQHLQKNFDFYRFAAHKELKKLVRLLSNYSRRIVVDLPYYYKNGMRYAQEINKRLTFGKPLEDLKVTRQEVNIQQHWQHERLKHLNCSKCMLNDVGESLYDGDNLYLYDRKTYLAIITDGTHLSQAGLRRVGHRYGDIIEKLIAELS